MSALTLLVVSKPEARYLRLLERLPDDVRIVAGIHGEVFRHAAPEADVLLNCMAPLATLREVFQMAPRLRWVHSLSAGVENTLFAELIDHPAPLTNARGVYSRSLAEFTLGAALYFSKDFGRMKRQQEAGRWEEFDVEELHGKTIGIVGYGSIGEACARLARAFGMKVLALRRRPQLSQGDPLVDRIYGRPQLQEMLAASDFVVVAAPLTAETRGLLGERELRAMKQSAVLINVGRGPVVAEAALISALREGWIRGAALDVFIREPLPEGHPFYSLANLLLSPHCADHTPGWADQSMEFFLENFERFRKGEPLRNLVDKRAGY